MDGVALLTVFVLTAFVGYEVISKVSSTLHTPLMSGSNAISGIVLVGTIVVAARADNPALFGLALVAVALGAPSVVQDLAGLLLLLGPQVDLGLGSDGRGEDGGDPERGDEHPNDPEAADERARHRLTPLPLRPGIRAPHAAGTR